MQDVNLVRNYLITTSTGTRGRMEPARLYFEVATDSSVLTVNHTRPLQMIFHQPRSDHLSLDSLF